MLIDPSFQLKYAENMARKNPNIMKEFDRIINNAGNAVISSPYEFYRRIVKPFIITRGWDPYRRYSPGKMTRLRIVQPYRIMTGGKNWWEFGTNKMRDSRGKSERDILKDLARRDSQEPGSFTDPKNRPLTPTEKKFIERLQGKARDLFQAYKKRFEASRGPRTPTFRR
jgi:hypothetical protein